MALLNFRRKQEKKERESAKSNYIPVSIPMWNLKTYDGQILLRDSIVASIDALARNIGKMELKAVREKKDQLSVDETTSEVARVLKNPNKYMTQYDFLYKITAMYYATNNVFIWPQYENGKLVALWPINYQSFNLYQTEDGVLVAQFVLNWLKTYTVPYSDLIHLRRHYFNDPLFGDDNTPLNPIGELLDAQSNGIINAIKNSAIIRGILKAVQVLKDEDINKAKEKFIHDNFNARNNGGVIAIDGKFDYTNLESKPYVIDPETRKVTKDMVHDYFGTNEDFVQNKFSSEGYEAVYEGELEPFAKMIQQAFTKGLFTENQQAHGNKVEANVVNLRYQTTSTVVQVIEATRELGLFTRDEYRAMLGYQPLGPERGGDEIMVAVNNYGSMTSTDEGDGTNE